MFICRGIMKILHSVLLMRVHYCLITARFVLDFVYEYTFCLYDDKLQIGPEISGQNHKRKYKYVVVSAVS